MRLKFRGSMVRVTDSRDQPHARITPADLNERNARYWNTNGQLVGRFPKDRYRIEERDDHFRVFDMIANSESVALPVGMGSLEEARTVVSDSEAPMVRRLRAFQQLFQQRARRIS